MIYADQKYPLEVEDNILYFIYNQLKLALQKKEKKYPQNFIEQKKNIYIMYHALTSTIVNWYIFVGRVKFFRHGLRSSVRR